MAVVETDDDTASLVRLPPEVPSTCLSKDCSQAHNQIQLANLPSAVQTWGALMVDHNEARNSPGYVGGRRVDTCLLNAQMVLVVDIEDLLLADDRVGRDHQEDPDTLLLKRHCHDGREAQEQARDDASFARNHEGEALVDVYQ